MSAPKKIQTTWVQPTDRRKEFVALSDIEFWVAHWDQTVGRTRKCGEKNCAMCLHGYSKKLCMVCLVRDDRGEDFWLEIRERHRDVIDQGCPNGKSFAGSRLVVRREGSAKNSPVSIQMLGRELVEERCIKNFVAGLGLPPILIALDSTSKLEREA